MTTGALSIPSWEVTTLAQLTNEGKLSGIPSGIVGAIDQAESSGTGGSINSKGYGGYFGLSQQATYPGGATTPQLLEATTTGAFAAQAEIAASEFASLLPTVGGTVFKAEQTYQTGKPTGFGEGDQTFASVFGTTIPPITSASPASKATLTGWVTDLSPATGGALGIANIFTGGALTTAPGTTVKKAAHALVGSAWKTVGPFLAKAMLVVGGIGLVVIAGAGMAKRPVESAAHDAGDAASAAAPAAMAAAA